MGESFITFASKVHSLGHDKFQSLADLKIKFGNGAYNLTMHKAVVCVATVMTDKMREVISEIENVYGKDVISSSYNKIYRLVSAAQKASADDKRSNGLSVAWAGQWLVESLLVALRTNKLTVSGVTLLTLDKHHKTSAPGLLQVWICRLQARMSWFACGCQLTITQIQFNVPARR